jgi:uncharacterized protein YjbI with pentapeptide repeats
LSAADLRDANLKDADHGDVDLSDADLRNARLSGAVLDRADHSGAKVTQEQLGSDESLEGATMPNGQKYEDWLKSKDSGEDGENSGPS